MSEEDFSVYFEGFRLALVHAHGGRVYGPRGVQWAREVRVWGENADRFFADAGAMIRWIDQPSIVPLLAGIAEKHKRQFRDYVVRRMLEETQRRDGRCFETFRRVNVFARK